MVQTMFYVPTLPLAFKGQVEQNQARSQGGFGGHVQTPPFIENYSF